MGLADLFRPKYRHSNAVVRAEAVRALSSEDLSILTQVAKTDRDLGVRRLAVEKIDEADVLADIAAAETERSLRERAGERAVELWQAAACGDDAELSAAALGGIIKLGDQHALVEVAIRAQLPASRKRAFGELRDPRALADLAKRDAPQDVRTAAVARIDDGDVLRALAIDTTSKEVGLAAVDKLDDADRLENIAQKAKNKAVRQRARKIVAEMAEAEAKAKPGVSDDVKRRRAERAQLIREVEALAESHELAKASAQIAAAEAAWGALAADADDEVAARFARAVARFARRRELHEQQARTSDELRAVEREAAASRARAAEERAAASAARRDAGEPGAAAAPAARDRDDAPDDYVRAMPAPADDKARAAREAEAQARREERERTRAEQDARRAAAQAEAEARRKEETERVSQLLLSMTAMVADLEGLAGSRDGRGADDGQRGVAVIDRALQQAAKLFGQIGKLPPAERDALGDRYTAARGKLVIRVSELREAEDWARFANVPKAEALIETARAMGAEEPSADLANRLRQLQALWKEAGPMPQKRSKELWDTFKQACDAVYDKVRGVRAAQQEQHADAAKRKEELIAQAEALADSTDWGETAAKLKALQAEWKDSGNLPRKQGDELWTRFRSACDRFFERRKPQLDAAHDAEEANLVAKQALIDRARAIAEGAPGVMGWGKAIGAIKDVQAAWKEIGYVPRREADRVNRELRAACDAVFAKRDADRAREQAEGDAQPAELDPAAAREVRAKLIARAEALVAKQAAAATAAQSPADVAAQLKQAMSKNAFGELRWESRDPAVVIAELHDEWRAAGAIADDEGRAQQAQLDAVLAKLPAARPAAETAASVPPSPTPATVLASPDAVTQPVKLPPPPPDVRAEPLAEPPPKAEPRADAKTEDDVDGGWDLGDADPTAKSTPSSSEMAGDGAPGGDGITDDSGWD